jgi:hypothetical protein
MHTTSGAFPGGRAGRARQTAARAALVLAIGVGLALAGTSRVAVRHSPREGSPSIGPAKATDTLVLFTDYQ